ncbi:MAG: hypothetical protein GY786_22305 [Proteobacteria bacterium]|nr:hypothetical protein [Pseudomonadota bacterium]
MVQQKSQIIGKTPKRFVWVLFLILVLFVYPAFGQDTTADSQEKSGGTYYRNKGQDIDKLVERQADKDGEANFDISLQGKLPRNEAVLSIYAYDIDEERGETNKVYFNGHYLGNLSGTNDTWNTTVFNLNLKWLLPGINKVKVIFTDTSKSGRIKWSGRIGWGQLLIDGGSGELGQIENQALSFKNTDGNVVITPATSIAINEGGSYRLEMTMMDTQGNALASVTKDYNLKKGASFGSFPQLRYQTNSKSGSYKIVSNLFYQKEGFWLQQSVYRQPFGHIRNKGAFNPRLKIANPIKDISVMEDAPEIQIDISSVFDKSELTLLNSESKKQAIDFELSDKGNPALLSYEIVDDKIRIKLNKDQFGRTDITLKARFEASQAEDVFSVTVQPVEDKIVLLKKEIILEVDEDALPTVLHLKDLFFDADHPDLFGVDSQEPPQPKITPEPFSLIGNDNPLLLSAIITNRTIRISYLKDRWGEGNLQIQALLDGDRAILPIRIKVRSVKDPLIIANPVETLNVSEGDDPKVINLADLFFSADINGNTNLTKKEIYQAVTITKQVLSNSGAETVNATILGDELRLVFPKNRWGKAKIILQGEYRGEKISSPIDVIVSKIKTPIVLKPVPEQVVDENIHFIRVDLNSVFGLPVKKKQLQSDDSLVNDQSALIVPSIVANSNSRLATASIKNNILLIKVNKGNVGTGTFTLRGTYRGKYVDHRFAVKVNSIDHPPIVKNPIKDITTHIGAGMITVDISKVFFETNLKPEKAARKDKPADTTEQQKLTLSLVEKGDPDLVTVELKDSSLFLTPNINTGQSTITIRGTSKNKWVDHTFKILVNDVPSPIINRKIPDLLKEEDSDNFFLDLSEVFTFPPSEESKLDDNNINITLKSLSNNNLIDAQISEGALIISLLKDANGSSEIILEGEAFGKRVEQRFNIIVTPVDDPPVVNIPLNKLTYPEDSKTKVIDLKDLFTDIDNNDELMFINVVENTNERLIKTVLQGDKLSLSFRKDGFGEAKIKIQVKSNEKFAHTILSIAVQAVDDAPFIHKQVENVIAYSDSNPITISLADVFRDVDNLRKDIQFSTSLKGGSDLINTRIINGELVLYFNEEQTGAVEVELKGTVNNQDVVNRFKVMVNPTPKILYGYYSTGIQSIDSFSEAMNLNIGLEYTLNHWIKHLRAEIGVGGNVDKHESVADLYNQNLNYTTAHSQEKDVVTLGLFLNQRLLIFSDVIQNYSVEVRGKVGLVYWEENLLSLPLNDSDSANRLSSTEKKTSLGIGIHLFVPLLGNAGMVLNLLSYGGEINKVSIGYQSSGRIL